MKIDILDLTNGGHDWVGKEIWVADFRQPDLTKKPIRHVRPTLVQVVHTDMLPKDKRIYYSQVYLVPISRLTGKLSRTIIGIYDNTGYRSYAGQPLQAFTTEQEAVDSYNAQADEVISRLIVKRGTAVDELNKQIAEILAEKDKVIAAMGQ